MIAKLPSNNIDNRKTDVDFDVEIVKYVRQNRFVRRAQLIEHMMNVLQRTRGCSRPSVERKLARMTKNGSLVIVKHKDLAKYGLHEEDERASYLTLKEIFNINEYLDTLFSHFESDDEYDKNSILNEIDLYKDTYSLSRKQLDVLVDSLLITNEKLQFHILRILKEYILDREITPTNKEGLLKSLNELLGKFAGVSRDHEDYRTGMIFILGYFEDDSIINWLKYDIELNFAFRKEIDEATFKKIKDDYGSIYTAWIIDKHKLELFNLINDFKKEGKNEEARLVYNIKHEVAKLLGHIKEVEADF
ncbi:hypothetical protein Mpsy_0171 [Methanolobus psychrophilus R15]|nr:hypothetical protein Mpsy_0171 [Methanolobus psychrophilus R15]